MEFDADSISRSKLTPIPNPAEISLLCANDIM